jgi:hypothetical protein
MCLSARDVTRDFEVFEELVYLHWMQDYFGICICHQFALCQQHPPTKLCALFPSRGPNRQVGYHSKPNGCGNSVTDQTSDKRGSCALDG